MILYTTVMFGLINIFCFYNALVFTVTCCPSQQITVTVEYCIKYRYISV